MGGEGGRRRRGGWEGKGRGRQREGKGERERGQGREIGGVRKKNPSSQIWYSLSYLLLSNRDAVVSQNTECVAK